MKTCALVIGHKKTSPGAVNKSQNLSEFDYNEQLAMDIEYALKDQEDVHVQKVYRRTYDSLPTDINELAPDFIVSLHCNAFNRKASGTEVLFYHKSKKGKELAKTLNKSLVKALGLPNRGVKAKGSEDRGGYLLKKTSAPCLIAEPFFIDNDEDLAVAETRYAELVRAYAKSISKMAKLV